MSKLKETILLEYKNGNVVIATIDGLKVAKLSEFIKQDVNLLLYDLNRNEETILTFIDDPKWINDLATCQVIRALKKDDKSINIDSDDSLLPIKQWFAKKTNRQIHEFDEFDNYVCKVINEYKIENDK